MQDKAFINLRKMLVHYSNWPFPCQSPFALKSYLDNKENNFAKEKCFRKIELKKKQEVNLKCTNNEKKNSLD